MTYQIGLPAFPQRPRSGMAREHPRRRPPQRSSASIAMPTLDELGGILWRRKFWIAATTAVSVVLGLGYALTAKKVYSSEAQLLLNPNALQIVDNDLSAGGKTPDTQSMQIDSELHVLRSPATLEKVAERLDLDTHLAFGSPQPTLKSRLKSAVTGGDGGEIDRRRTAVEALSEAISVERVRGAFVVSIRVRTTDAQMSADIANTLAEVYLAERIDARVNNAERVTDSLDGRIESLRTQLQQSEEAVERFKATYNLSASGGGLLSDQQLQSTNAQLASARSRTAAARAILEQIEGAKRAGNLDSVAEAVRSGTITQLRGQQAELKRQFADRSATLGPKHPDLIALRDQLREIDGLVAGELDRIARVARNDLERAQSNETLLAHQVRELEKQSFSTNETLLKLREMQREAESRRAVYESFLERAQELHGQKDLDPSEARIIAAAYPASSAATPSPVLVLAGALFFGVGMGSGLSVLRELTDPTFSSKDAMARAVGLPVIADFTLQHPGSTQSEAVNETLGGLLARLQGGKLRKHPKIVLFVSPAPSDVKTMMILEMMDRAVDQRLSTILVDGDPEYRRLSNSAGDHGLVNFEDIVDRLGGNRLGDAVAAPPRCWMLPLRAGTGGLLAGCSGPRVERALRRLGAMADFIFIDGAVPQSPESIPALADAADEIVILADPHAAKRVDFDDMLHELSDNLDKCAGIVVHGRSLNI